MVKIKIFLRPLEPWKILLCCSERVDCKKVGFFFTIGFLRPSREVFARSVQPLALESRVCPQSCTSFLPSLQVFCLTAPSFLTYTKIRAVLLRRVHLLHSVERRMYDLHRFQTNHAIAELRLGFILVLLG